MSAGRVRKSQEYTHLDADEIVLYHSKEDAYNYIDLLPIEIKNIITLYIDEEKYFNLSDLNMEDPKSLTSIMNKLSNTITDQMKTGEDMSLIEVLKKIDIISQFDNMKDSMGINTFQNIFDKLQNEYGIGNIISDMQKKVAY